MSKLYGAELYALWRQSNSQEGWAELSPLERARWIMLAGKVSAHDPNPRDRAQTLYNEAIEREQDLFGPSPEDADEEVHRLWHSYVGAVEASGGTWLP